jgi:hypothetical protein
MDVEKCEICKSEILDFDMDGEVCDSCGANTCNRCGEIQRNESDMCFDWACKKCIDIQEARFKDFDKYLNEIE